MSQKENQILLNTNNSYFKPRLSKTDYGKFFKDIKDIKEIKEVNEIIEIPENPTNINNETITTIRENTLDTKSFRFSHEDNMQTLLKKNEILLNTNLQFQKMLDEKEEEKFLWLKELDVIKENYQNYAESHKNLKILQESYEKLSEEYNSNAAVLKEYQDIIK